MALAEIYTNPGEISATLLKLFTPEEPQMSPEEEAMMQGGMGGPPGMPPGGAPPGGAPQSSPESMQTILSMIEGQGGGVQSVARV
jgi:hypothetical protein